MTDQRQLAVKPPSANQDMVRLASTVEVNIAELHQIMDAEIRALQARVTALEAQH